MYNLVVGGKKLNRIIFSKGLGVLMILYLLVVSPHYRRHGKISRFVDAFAVPIPKLHYTIWFIAVVGIAQLLVSSSRQGEIVEFSTLFILFLIIAFPFNLAIFSPDDVPKGCSSHVSCASKK